MQSAEKAMVLDDLWTAYRRDKDIETRNTLIEAYMPIVRRQARKVAATLTSSVTAQELESAGTLGLIDSIDNFDPSQGWQFVTFCTPRVRGAMIDELRSLDWTPRATRAKLNKFDRTVKALEKKLGRQAETDEIVAATGLSHSEIRQLARDRSRLLLSLDSTWGNGQGEEYAPAIEDKRGGDPLSDLQKKEISEAVRNTLTRNERLVITLYYYEQLNLREIGQVLGLTESRICQIHSKVVQRLQKLFN